MLWHNKRSIRLHLYRVCCCFSWHYIHLSEGSVLWLQRCGLSQTSQTSTVSLKCLIIPVVFRLCLVHAPDSKSEPDSLFTLQNSDMKKFQVSRVRGVPVLIKPVSQRTFHSNVTFTAQMDTAAFTAPDPVWSGLITALVSCRDAVWVWFLKCASTIPLSSV